MQGKTITKNDNNAVSSQNKPRNNNKSGNISQANVYHGGKGKIMAFDNNNAAFSGTNYGHNNVDGNGMKDNDCYDWEAEPLYINSHVEICGGSTES